MTNAFSKKIKIKNDRKGLLVLFNKKTDEDDKFIKVQDGLGVNLWVNKSWIYKHHLRRDQYAVILDLTAEKEFNTHYEKETKKFFDLRAENGSNSISVNKLIRGKINGSNMTPEQRKYKVRQLRIEHRKYFDSLDGDFLYIPKMAYRPKGKDDMYVSFFPSELEKGKDIYTEFVSYEYDSEDPKRTLYLLKYNKDWKDIYEINESSSGYKRHLVPVSKLKIINDVTSRNKEIITFDTPLENPDDNQKDLFKALNTIAKQLDRIATILDKKLN